MAVAQAAASAFSCTAIPPAGIWPPACWRRIGKAFASDAPADLVPAAYAISGVFDLAPLVQCRRMRICGSTRRKRGGVSPLYWRVPAGRTLDAVVGALESSEFLRQSKIIAESWGARGVATRYEEIAGAEPFHRGRSRWAIADSAMTGASVPMLRAKMVSALTL